MSNKTKKTESVEKYTRVPEIYTCGAHCAPFKRPNLDTRKMEWVWIVNRFEDESFMDMDGGDDVYPNERAKTREKLIEVSECENEPKERILISEGVLARKTLRAHTTVTHTVVAEIDTIGAYCAPLKRRYPPHTDEIEWLWVVTRFDDDSYVDGHLVIPNHRADTREGLIKKFFHTPEEKTVLSEYPYR